MTSEKLIPIWQIGETLSYSVKKNDVFTYQNALNNRNANFQMQLTRVDERTIEVVFQDSLLSIYEDFNLFKNDLQEFQADFPTVVYCLVDEDLRLMELKGLMQAR